jgi:hypothetical protein
MYLSVVKCLPNMYEALDLIPASRKKRQKKKLIKKISSPRYLSNANAINY